MQMQEVIKYTVKAEVEEIVKQKMEEMKSVMDAAKQEVDAAKQEVDAAKQETDVVKKLTKVLLDAGRFEDLRRITMDKAYLEKIQKEFSF